MTQQIGSGQLLGGRYRLVDLLSESGDGRFWRARDLVLERHVALHVIAASDPRADLLLDAARRSAQVVDRRVLRVLDAEVRGPICYVVNEWAWGTSLDVMIGAGGSLGPRRSAYLVSGIADALSRAHEAGVTHGRLTPESVLVDLAGEVRLLGLAVDAALHGLPGPRDDDEFERARKADLVDLAGLLYCALTGKWAGASRSGVPDAPTSHGHVLRPRRVRAGVPRPLDVLCDELLCGHPHRHSRAHDFATAARIRDHLDLFIGDRTGLRAALAASAPPPPVDTQVVLPNVPDFTPHDAEQLVSGPSLPPPLSTPANGSAVLTPDEQPDQVTGLSPDPVPGPTPDPDQGPVSSTLLPPMPTAPAPAAPSVPVVTSEPAEPAESPVTAETELTPRPIEEQPTEAGMPIFGTEEVDWVTTRSTPPPPPPPFSEPPERPLFATTAERKPRPGVATRPGPFDGAASSTGSGFWPWETGTDSPRVTTDTGLTPVVDEEMPGRNSFRAGLAVLAAALLLIVGVVAYSLSTGRGPLGEVMEGDDPTPTPTSTPSPTVLSGLRASDLDPQGGGDENPDEVGLALDGDPTTAWSTQTYTQQLGPEGLKTGVGLVVDLGRTREVTSTTLRTIGQPTGVDLYLSPIRPADIDDQQPIASSTITSDQATLTPDGTPRGRFLVVWLTQLPAVDGGFRGEIAEVQVRGR